MLGKSEGLVKRCGILDSQKPKGMCQCKKEICRKLASPLCPHGLYYLCCVRDEGTVCPVHKKLLVSICYVWFVCDGGR